MSSWVAEEVRGSKLPDIRLEERLELIVARLAARPEASIPQAMGCWAETKAAYRFLDSARVTPEAIRAGYIQSCAQRLGALSTALIIQDTTALDFTHHPGTKGLGYLDNPNRRGLIVHTSLVCTTEGVPLGILAQDVWVRDLEELGKTEDRRKRSPADKESNKWIKALEASNSVVPSGVETVTIGDSEADVFELFVAERPIRSQLLIRVGQNR